ncbi:MAG: protein-disulfide reductase DsbD family protein [Niabella sp.]
MKTIVIFLSLILGSLGAYAQIKQPAKWNFSAKKIDATTYEVHLTAVIDAGWHTYSQTTPDGGPVATDIKFVTNPLVIIQGPAKEIGKLEQKHEPIFGVDVKQFSNKVDFVQTVKLKGKVKTMLNGTIEYMTCNDRECLPPTTQKFSIALK